MTSDDSGVDQHAVRYIPTSEDVSSLMALLRGESRGRVGAGSRSARCATFARRPVSWNCSRRSRGGSARHGNRTISALSTSRLALPGSSISCASSVRLCRRRSTHMWARPFSFRRPVNSTRSDSSSSWIFFGARAGTSGAGRRWASKNSAGWFGRTGSQWSGSP